MCDGCAPASGPGPGITRRHVLAAGLATGAVLALPARPAGAQGFAVLPRSAWAGDLPAGRIPPEPDVRTLVVHHTVDANAHGPDDVVTLLRRIHGFHTGPEKGWPDVAYNFFVDRFGRVWEGRAGSLAGAVAGDATGGSQGFDQKCAFLGDHRTEPPTPEATDAMASLLAMLADRHGIDTAPGATATFASRGSNRHPAGAVVTVPTITGHRTVSQTACPGDAGMTLVDDVLPVAVSARRQVASTTTTTAPATTTTAPAPATPTPAPEIAASPPTTADTMPSTTWAGADSGTPRAAPPTAVTQDQGSDRRSAALPAGVAAIAALGAGILALRARRNAP